MDSNKTNKDTKASSEHEPQTTDYQQSIKEMRRTLIRTVIFLSATFVVMILATVAWFVSNNGVNLNSITISADGKMVELRSYGDAGVHDDVLMNILGTDGSRGFWYTLGDAFNETSQAKTSINWLISDDSNIGNYSSTSIDWNDSANQRQDMAIEPGSHGKLTFYVVPKYNGDVSLHMDLDLIPYGIVSGEYTENQDGDVSSFVEGHIMFFLVKEDGSDNGEIEWLQNGTFDITIDSAIKNTEYQYTLYWCWPQTFAELILKSGDMYLNGRATLFSEFSNGETIRENILFENESYSMVSCPERYFYSNLTGSHLETDQAELAAISGMYNKASEAFTEDEKNAFVELSSYYNQADQHIGKHVDCIRIKLTAN